MVAKELRDAEDAIRWAKRHSWHPSKNNYEATLTEASLRIARGTFEVYDFITECCANGMKLHSWPCIARMLVLDKPELLPHLKIHFILALDSQGGTSLISTAFREITGRTPKVRSWRKIEHDA